MAPDRRVLVLHAVHLFLKIIFDSIFVQYSTDNTDGSNHVNFFLTFRGDQDVNLPKLLIAIIVENAHRETINNRIVLVVGPLNVFEDSLQQDHTNSMVVTGGGTTLATPSGKYKPIKLSYLH